MVDRDRPGGSMSGLSDQEAKEFHSLFMTSFLAFTAVAAVAHYLVWSWRPWLPGPRGYTAVMDDAVQTASLMLPFIT